MLTRCHIGIEIYIAFISNPQFNAIHSHALSIRFAWINSLIVFCIFTWACKLDWLKHTCLQRLLAPIYSMYGIITTNRIMVAHNPQLNHFGQNGRLSPSLSPTHRFHHVCIIAMILCGQPECDTKRMVVRVLPFGSNAVEWNPINYIMFLGYFHKCLQFG